MTQIAFNKTDINDLTRKIIRALFNTYNKLGYGYREKEYQKGFVVEITALGLNFKRELYSVLKYDQKIIGKFYVDFLIEGTVVVELKVADEIYRKHFQQVLAYLKNHNIKIGLLAVFTPTGVKIKRIAN